MTCRHRSCMLSSIFISICSSFMRVCHSRLAALKTSSLEQLPADFDRCFRRTVLLNNVQVWGAAKNNLALASHKPRRMTSAKDDRVGCFVQEQPRGSGTTSRFRNNLEVQEQP
eukprot:gene7443-biopygen14174